VVNVQPLADGDPHRLGDYDVTGRLGEGGQGVVYLATGPAGSVGSVGSADSTGPVGSVAIKVLHAQLIEDEPARARFVREVEVTKRVARFCTAQVLSAGLAEGRPYIVSEYVPGPSLHRQLRDDGPRRGSALDRLAINTATALAAIHQAGVVHRDFKPGNVLMGPDGPVVIDFGISRALDASGTMTSAVSQVVGTPAFMAPEQLADGVIGPHTDMFAWAITMVYAANGVPAFGHRSIPQVINRILHEEPDLGTLDGRLRPAVAACLSKDPSRRPTARRLMDELMGHNLGTFPSPSGAPGVPGGGTAGFGTAGPDEPGRGAPGLGAAGLGTAGLGAAGLGAAGLGAAGLGAADAAGRLSPPGTSADGGAGTAPTSGPVPPDAGTAYLPAGGSPSSIGGPGRPVLPEHGTVRMPASGPSSSGGAPGSPGSPGMPVWPGQNGPPERRKSRTALIVTAVVVAAVALIAGIGALAANGDGTNDQAAASPSPTQRAHRPARHRTPSPSRTPTRHPAAAKSVQINPHKPQQLCGAGYRVIDSHPVGGARIYLLYNAHAGANCVLTMVARSSGRIPLSASLIVRGGGHQSRSGTFMFYAGPVRLPAKGKCVQWGGATRSAKWASGWSHCGK
jgi:predicted Ser/Thr protein kinase